jgi:uncharacterized protein (DUF2141 family)
MKSSSFLALCTLTCVSAYTFAQEPLTLTVEVSGAEANEGQAIFDLFDSKDNFLDRPILSRTMKIDNQGHARFVITDLTAGTYAFSVIHDEDSNGELKTGFLGIPKEKVAVSNNVVPRFGPPKYRDAEFELIDSITLSVSLQDPD